MAISAGNSSKGQEPDVKKRAAIYSLCAAAMTMCGLVLGAAPASASIHNTPGYVHIVNAGSGKCLDLAEPTPVQWRCLNTPFEEWQFVDAVDGLYFQIVSHQTRECLAAEGDENGSPVVMEPCAPLDHTPPVSQLWIVGPAGSSFQVGRAGQYVCLDLENGDPGDGVPMQVWGCNPNTNNQRWRQL
jgi:hypothetical protein